MFLARRAWLAVDVAVLVISPAHAQYQLHQRPDQTTSDDARRVPIPPWLRAGPVDQETPTIAIGLSAR